MAPFRMPFSSKRATPNHAAHLSSENTHPNDPNSPYGKDKPSLALGIKERKLEPNEFKLSSVNDSGEYLPPSPYEKPSFWGKSPSSTSTAQRSVFSDNEPFSISRESFDSYRRSFDVSGRSPIIHSDSYTSRSSFDSRMLPRSAITSSTFDKPGAPRVEDVGFEDVGLHDEVTKPKKKSFLSRFGDTSTTTGSDDTKTHHFNLLSGRRRGQSGTGSELGNMSKATNAPAVNVARDVSVQ